MQGEDRHPAAQGGLSKHLEYSWAVSTEVNAPLLFNSSHGFRLIQAGHEDGQLHGIGHDCTGYVPSGALASKLGADLIKEISAIEPATNRVVLPGLATLTQSVV